MTTSKQRSGLASGSTKKGMGRLVIGLGAVAVAISMAGCSTVKESSAVAGDSSSLSAEQSAVLKAGYSGEAMQKPTETGPKAVKGKNVWVISCGESYQACANLSASFVEASKELGWTSKLVDSKADPSVYSNSINQAVAAKADAIALFSGDCPGIKSSLVGAKQAGIPVVQFTSIDCDDPAFGGEAPLFTGSVNVMGSTKIADYYKKWGAARADYLAALMGGEGKILEVREASQRTHAYSHEGFTERMAQACPKCKIVDVPFTFAQVPNQATQIWASALLQNPDAKAVSVSIDSLMGLGLESAIKQANFKGIIAGGEGLNLDLVRSGAQTTETAISYEMASWGLASTLNRIFSGEDPTKLPTEGGGWVFLDKDHNLPEAGKSWTLPFDFKAIYRKIWNG
jgi:ribose transport system substrate-binding protein